MNFFPISGSCTKLFPSTVINYMKNIIGTRSCLMSTLESKTEIEKLAKKIKVPERHPYPLMIKVRTHFPRAKETKRIVTHGFDVRMETSGGRRVLMRRILKGRYNISH